MSRFLIIGVFLFLSGCSQFHYNEDRESFFTGGVDSGAVIHIPVMTTGTIELSPDEYRGPSGHNPYFYSMSGAQGCMPSESMGFTPTLLCEGVKSYDHLYKVPSLRLEYLYDSEMLGFVDDTHNTFFTATGGIIPFILSGNMIYWSGIDYANGNNILMLQKDPNDEPLDIIKGHLGKGGCQIDTGRFSTGYETYGVWLFRDINNEDRTDLSNRCIPDLPIDWGNDSWMYVFSASHPDYYYIVGMNMIASSGPAVYTDQSLKLFVE